MCGGTFSQPVALDLAWMGSAQDSRPTQTTHHPPKTGNVSYTAGINAVTNGLHPDLIHVADIPSTNDAR